ncbi:MAG: hypothetical protein P8I03_03965 [Thalassotalea sp.]|nr:hypothetical protein [Thalassotalea sp.]
MSRPANRLSFVRNPDNSRVERWKPISPDFEIVFEEGKEYLNKKDGSSFEHAELMLTPTYKHLSKDYAPFSPYSDSGVLIYTGRLFACIDMCTEDVNDWRVSMNIPLGEHLIVNGKVYTNSTNWVDRDDGMNIYVGRQKPIETDSVIAVIDSGLPEEIKLSLSADIPKLMVYFQERLGKLNGVKPTLFASYAKVDDRSSQGGTLPNQIFMHWNLNDLDAKVKDTKFINQTTWFFAHEVAHLYQRSKFGVLYGEPNQSWLHEGNADWLAALALLDLYPKTEEYITEKVGRFKKHCVDGLKELSLIEATNEGQFGLYYTCGLLIHRAIDHAVQKKSNGLKNIYSLWNEFRQKVEHGDEKGPETFLTLVEQYTSKELVIRIKKLVETKLSSPEDILNRLSIDQ